MENPLFLAVEAIDGAGKSTLVKEILEYLKSIGYDAVRFSNPGTTYVGKELRRILLNEEQNPQLAELSPRVQWPLFMAGTADVAEKRVRPALAEGKFVVQDRWTLSTVVYQLLSLEGGYWGSEEMLRALVQITLDVCPVQPHFCFYLDVDPLVAKARLQAAGGGADRFEAVPLEMFESRAKQYRRLLTDQLVPYPVIEVPANGPIEEVWEITRDHLERVLAAHTRSD